MGLVLFAAGIAGAIVLGEQTSHGSRKEASPTAPTSRPNPRSVRVHRVRGPHNRPVPILTYHVVARAPANAAYPQLFVAPAALAAQTAWLAAHGYHAVTLKQVFAYWRRAAPLPAKPIVLSFDDGYLSDYAVALPTLRRHRWPGVLNLVVRNVARGDIQPWQVRRLIAAGWEIDAHTVSHVDLTKLGPARMRYEVEGSRRQLRRIFHEPVQFFCYPVGHYDPRIVAAVKAAGFEGATTETEGLARANQPFSLARIRIEPGDGVPGLVAKLRQYAR
jgi:peptidoglycan/xylan/chitin deacetylase (PgdA/CDA1 family)